jgi:peptidoglycan/xylan/chitin deacetylase (PgdA/CDA1 family)
VRPSHFRQQLDILRELYTPVSLRALTDALQLGADVRDYVALTFDDGYRDFIDNALPELERLDMPATIFVATGFSGKSFWWDEVVAALDPTYRDSSSLTLRWPNASGTQVYSSLDTRDGATHVIRDLCRELSLYGADVRAQMLEHICNDERRNSGFLDTARPMLKEDIRGLARRSGIEIGSHTVSHCQLAHLAESEQVSEIQSSKRELEALVADEIRAFSYPHGSISAHSRRHLEKSGFLYACASREAVAPWQVAIRVMTTRKQSFRRFGLIR